MNRCTRAQRRRRMHWHFCLCRRPKPTDELEHNQPREGSHTPSSVLLARRCAVRRALAVRLAHRTRHAHAEVGTTVGTRLHIGTRTGHTHGTATGHMGHMDMERAPSRSAPPHLPYSSTRIYIWYAITKPRDSRKARPAKVQPAAQTARHSISCPACAGCASAPPSGFSPCW